MDSLQVLSVFVVREVGDCKECSDGKHIIVTTFGNDECIVVIFMKMHFLSSH